jgi:hypothetical protein
MSAGVDWLGSDIELAVNRLDDFSRRGVHMTRRNLSEINASGQGRGRTADTRIFSPMLYQLSYLTARKWASHPASDHAR